MPIPATSQRPARVDSCSQPTPPQPKRRPTRSRRDALERATGWALTRRSGSFFAGCYPIACGTSWFARTRSCRRGAQRGNPLWAPVGFERSMYAATRVATRGPPLRPFAVGDRHDCGLNHPTKRFRTESGPCLRYRRSTRASNPTNRGVPNPSQPLDPTAQNPTNRPPRQRSQRDPAR